MNGLTHSTDRGGNARTDADSRPDTLAVLGRLLAYLCEHDPAAAERVITRWRDLGRPDTDGHDYSVTDPDGHDHAVVHVCGPLCGLPFDGPDLGAPVDRAGAGDLPSGSDPRLAAATPLSPAERCAAWCAPLRANGFDASCGWCRA